MQDEQIIRLVRGQTISLPKRFRGRFVKVLLATEKEVKEQMAKEKNRIEEEKELMERLSRLNKLKSFRK
jgi:hypothetical protein